MSLKAPFPWFGGKRRIAYLVWERFGTPRGYIEPFFGSGAVLLRRPHEPGIETACELDPYVANFWRAVQMDPAGVAHFADWPVNEADLHARHRWLVRNGTFRQLMEQDPEYFDAQVAGWWAWGISCWIGGEWCSRRWWSQGQFRVGDEVPRKRPVLPNKGQARGINQTSEHLLEWMLALQHRLRRVRFVCGDWKRVVTKAVRTCDGITAIFLDPPYSHASGRSKRAIYGLDDFDVAAEVAAWAAEHGDDSKLRIALCGLEGEHPMPESWSVVPWSRPPGYGNTTEGIGAANADREVVWFSPHCLSAKQLNLLEEPG